VDTRIQYALLAIFFALLWWIIGVLSGSLAAYFVYFFSLESSGRDWPAVIAFVLIALGCGVFGMFRSWQLYNKKIAELTS